MSDCSYTLGNAVKRARGKLNLTQNQVANAANIDVRTVLNIENYKGNPKLEVLYPLVRALNLDTQEVFYPELANSSPALTNLHHLLTDCSEEEAEALIPIITSVLEVLRNTAAKKIE